MRKLLVLSIEVDGAIVPPVLSCGNVGALLRSIENGAVDGCMNLATISDVVDSPPAPVVPDEPDEVELTALAGFQVRGVRTVATMGELVAVLSQFPPAMPMARTLNYEAGELYIDEPC